MTWNEKEEYELRIKNMQSKIDYLREQRENLTTYAKKYEPLKDTERDSMVDSYDLGLMEKFWYLKGIDDTEAAHGIK